LLAGVAESSEAVEKASELTSFQGPCLAIPLLDQTELKTSKTGPNP